MYVAWENLHGLRKWFLKAEAIENGFKRANNLGLKVLEKLDAHRAPVVNALISLG